MSFGFVFADDLMNWEIVRNEDNLRDILMSAKVELIHINH